MDPEYTEKQLELIEEIQRVAKKLGTNQVSMWDFDEHRKIGSVTNIRDHFGSWNEAVEAAGLIPYPSGGVGKPILTEEELLKEIIRLHEVFGKIPTESRMNAHGHFSGRPYIARWGAFSKAREVAYEKYGYPKE